MPDALLLRAWYRSDATGKPGKHHSQPVGDAALRRNAGARPRSRLASTAGSAAAMARRGSGNRRSSIKPSWASCLHHSCGSDGRGLGDDALRGQTMLSQLVRREQASALAAVGGNAAQQTGNAVGGTQRPQRLGFGCAEKSASGHCQAAGTPADTHASPPRSRTPAPPRLHAHRSTAADRRERDPRPRSRRAAVRPPRGGGVRLPPLRATIAVGSAPVVVRTPPRAPAPVRD